MTEKRRKEIIALAHKYDVLILEDSLIASYVMKARPRRRCTSWMAPVM
jgi:DNA-binding transcriptional MocR family regulator